MPNPEPRGTEPQAHGHGKTIAAEVKRLLDQPAGGAPWTSLGPVNRARIKTISLDFDTPATRANSRRWPSNRARRGLHARVNLARLDSGEGLQKSLAYPVQAWSFGDTLTMLFLPGEVVVDYDTLIREQHADLPLWINAYSNDDPCYIASRRLYDEGGYEVDGSMLFYDRPSRLAPEASSGHPGSGWFAARVPFLPNPPPNECHAASLVSTRDPLVRMLLVLLTLVHALVDLFAASVQPLWPDFQKRFGLSDFGIQVVFLAVGAGDVVQPACVRAARGPNEGHYWLWLGPALGVVG